MSNNGYFVDKENCIDKSVCVGESLMDKARAKRKDNLFFLVIAFIALSLMLTVTVLNTYVFFIADVSGSSMEPTLYTYDKLITNRLKKAEVGDIVCIDMGNRIIIKRVIALGGQTVEIKKGLVYVDDKIFEEPYLPIGTYTNADTWQKYTLKENEVFYLGDNREPGASGDARQSGPCTIDQILGVVEDWSLRWVCRNR